MIQIDVSRVILGCVALSTLPTRRAAFRLLEEAVSCGITHFDTARIYGRGFSERVLGEFFAVHGGALRVTTKLGPPELGSTPLPTRVALPLNWMRRCLVKKPVAVAPGLGQPRCPTARIERQQIEASIEASLRWLQRSHIDVFLLHEALPQQLTDDARSLIAGLREDGTIGVFGIGSARNLIMAQYVDDPLCDVLQYDALPGRASDLLTKYPSKVHIHHSIFRNAQNTSRAVVLRDALAANGSGRVIFGTRSREHLRQNLGLTPFAHADR